MKLTEGSWLNLTTVPVLAKSTSVISKRTINEKSTKFPKPFNNTLHFSEPSSTIIKRSFVIRTLYWGSISSKTVTASFLYSPPLILLRTWSPLDSFSAYDYESENLSFGLWFTTYRKCLFRADVSGSSNSIYFLIEDRRRVLDSFCCFWHHVNGTHDGFDTRSE